MPYLFLSKVHEKKPQSKQDSASLLILRLLANTFSSRHGDIREQRTLQGGLDLPKEVADSTLNCKFHAKHVWHLPKLA